MAELVVALDLPDGGAALRMADGLQGAAPWFKVGSMLYAAEGPAIVRALTARGARVFLDLKWHDIPSVVGGAVSAAAGLVKVVGVGVLTSLDAQAYAEVVGRPVGGVAAELERLGRIGMASGLDGVVCSPAEVGRLRAALGAGALLVVPGIRRPGEEAGDQARTAAAAEAVAAGADLLVVGRPVTGAADPRGAALAILKEMAR